MTSNPPPPMSPTHLRFLGQGSVRVPNFVNGLDGEGRELRSTLVLPNTNTHTVFQDRLTGAPEATSTLAEEIARSLRGRAAFRSQRPRTATPTSFISNDPRHEHLRPPHRRHVGPGTYEIDLGRPPLGPLAPDSATRGAIPACDPLRPNRPFVSPERLSLAQPGPAHHLGSYLSPEFEAARGVSPDWYRGTTRRTAPSDWKFARVQCTEAGKKLGDATASMLSPESVGCSGRHVSVAGGARAAVSTSSTRGSAAFASKQPRLVALPLGRTNAVHLAPARSDEDPGANGPGTHHRTARPASAGQRQAQQLRSSFTWGKPKGPRTSFSSHTGRSTKWGPFSATTDSSLVFYR